MASIMDTLFGVSTERFQQERDAANEAQALQYSRLSPIEKASLGIQRGAYGLAGALGGALGGQDPELQRRTQAQQILGMIDPSKPDTFDMAAQIAADRGDQQLAFGLRLEGDKYRQQKLVRDDEAARRLREKTALEQQTLAQTIAQRAYQPGTAAQTIPESVVVDQAADTSYLEPQRVVPAVAPSYDIRRVAPQLQALGAPGLAQLTAGLAAEKAMRPETISVKEGEVLYNYPTSPGGEYKPVITGGAKPTPFTGDMANAANILFRTTDPAKIFAQAGQQGIDAVNAKALEITKEKRPVTNVTNTVSNNMQKGFGDTLTEMVSSNIKAGRAAVSANNAVQNMQTLLDEGVKTGFGQDTMLQLGRAGQFFDPEFKVKGLAGQEAFQSFATGVILPQVKQLGVNPTDTDLKFISTGSPGLSKTPEGNKLLLSALQLKLKREQDLAKFTNQFLASNQELVTKNPVQAYTKFNDAFDQYVQTSPLYGPAADSLRQRFNALGSRSTGNPEARDALQRGGLTRN